MAVQGQMGSSAQGHSAEELKSRLLSKLCIRQVCLPSSKDTYCLIHRHCQPARNCGATTFQKRCLSLIPRKVFLLNLAVVLRSSQLWNGQQFTSSSYILIKVCQCRVEKWSSHVATYFAPRCICIVYLWFYIFLQSRFPKTRKWTLISGNNITIKWEKDIQLGNTSRECCHLNWLWPIQTDLTEM